jgi:Transcription factor e(y)2
MLLFHGSASIVTATTFVLLLLIERIKHDLYAKLILNDAWRETMYQKTREAVHLRGGVPEITLGDLSRALIQTGSNAVPESVKKETIQQIQKASNNDV